MFGRPRDDRTVVGTGVGRGRSWSAPVVAATWVGAYVVLVVVVHLARRLIIPRKTLFPGDATGGLADAVRALVGRNEPRDFYVDYASAHAMLHGQNAYADSYTLFKGLGPAWNVRTANPHPPTLLPLVTPFTVFDYAAALSAWALLMALLYVATVRLLGVRLEYSVAIGLGVAVNTPGAFGLSNPVPIVGFGVALAYRFRNNPALAGLGIAVASMPKGSGLLLAIPFLAAGRIKTVLWAAGFYLVSALLPLAWQHDIWRQYYIHGRVAIRLNSGRADNASILHLARVHAGIPDIVTLIVLVAIAIGIAFAQRDLFWAPVWLMVATLPIAWMYSTLTLLPLLIFAVMTAPRRTISLAVLATALILGCPPFGHWPTQVFPVVVVLAGAACALARAPEPIMWFGPWRRRRPRDETVTAEPRTEELQPAT